MKRYTDKAEAYRLYLLGRYHWNKRTDDGLSKAMDYFRQAIDLDPNYALAYAGIADCYIVYGNWAQLHPREALLSAQAAATKALEIDEQLAEAHASLGVVRCRLDWKWPEAESEFKRALELNPSYATAHQWYAIYFEILGRTDEAIRQARQALEIDPTSLMMNASLAHRLYYARQYDLAIEQHRKTFEIDVTTSHAAVGDAYLQKGMYEEAIAAYQSGVTLSQENPNLIAALGFGYAMSGKTGEARSMLARLKQKARQEYVSPYSVATIYVGLGEADRAFEWLERAFREHAFALVYLKVDPRMDRLRSDPRFQDMLRRLGLAS